MRVISWNVNSVRARLPRLLELLRRHKPDVVCLQETKAPNSRGFPITQLNAVGYRTVLHGQPNYNGVAILVHDPAQRGDLWAFEEFSHEDIEIPRGFGAPNDVRRGFPGDPIPKEARVVSACVGNLRLVNVYVVNGAAREHEQFEIKRIWMIAIAKWLHDLPKTPPILVVGDFNVAPDCRDVWDPEGLKDRIHCTDEERAWLKIFQGERFKDLLRETTQEPGIYTWWPYQKDAFERNEGLRFDLALGDQKIADNVEKIWIDKEERKQNDRMGKPSDHAPVIIDLVDL